MTALTTLARHTRRLLQAASDVRRFVLPPLLRRRRRVVRHPFTLHNLELTNRCPFKCVMCPRTHNMTRAQGLMRFELFAKAIDELVAVHPAAAASRPVWLHGFGESLVHPEFGRFVRYAVDSGVRAGLSINPLMLTEKVAADLLAAEPAVLYCSLDGHDDATFEEIRGVADAWETSKRRLLEFLEQKVARGTPTWVVLSMIDFPMNRASIRETLAFWKSVPGIDKVLRKQFLNWDGNAPDVNELLPEPGPPATGRVTCYRPWSQMTLKWDGDVVPCCYDYDKRYVLGNLEEQSLEEIWNGEPMQRLREQFASGEVTASLCRNCAELRAPWGLARLRGYFQSGA